MKVGFLSLMLAAAGVVIPVAAQAVAEHYQLDIPRQQLDAALKDLAQQTGLQIARFSDTPGGSAFVGPVKGDMPITDALKSLLAPSQLTYKVVNDHTIAVMTFSAAATQTQTTELSGSSQSSSTVTEDNKQQGGKKSFWDNFRLAQANQGVAQKSSAVASDVQTTSGSSDKSPQLTEILVTAQKRGEERLLEVPVPITVLNAQALTDSNQVLLKDYATSVPGLSVSPNIENSQMVSIRGITTGGFSNPTVAVMIDDVPYGFLSGDLIPNIDPGDLARIEVLRGPQGTLYGADSMGGLIKYVTTNPSFDGFSSRVEAGTSGVYNGAEPGYSMRAALNVPITDSLALRVSAFDRQDPGYIDNPGLNIKGINEVQTEGARLATLWSPLDAFSLKFATLYEHTKGYSSEINPKGSLSEVDQAPLPSVPLTGDWQQGFVSGAQRFDRTIQAYSLTLTGKVGSVGLTSVTGYHVDSELGSFDYTPFYASFTQCGINPCGMPGGGFNGYGVTGTVLNVNTDTSDFTQELRLSAPVSSNVDWMIGAFYTHEHTPSYDTITASNSATGQVAAQGWYSSYPTTFKEYAGFTDLTYRFTDQLDVQIGGRESHISNEAAASLNTGPYNLPGFGTLSPVIVPAGNASANAFTYLLTPRFKVSSDLMVYARLASGYRPGGPNTGAPGAPPEYRPDKTMNYEVGLKGNFLDHMLTVDSSLYYIKWNDIQLQLFNSNGFSYYVNGSSAKSEGVELSVEVRPVAGLTIAGWFSYDNAVLTQEFPANTAYGNAGDRLPNTPRLSGGVSVQDDFPLSAGLSGFVGGQVTFTGDRQGVFSPIPSGSPARQDYPAYTRTDLHAGVKYASWTTNLYVNNLANIRGLINGGIGYIEPNTYVYITPRTFGVTISKVF